MRSLSADSLQAYACRIIKVLGYSYREICALTGTSHTNVNKHLTRGRARREALAA